MIWITLRLMWLARIASVGVATLAGVMVVAPVAHANAFGDILVEQFNAHGWLVELDTVVEVDEPAGHCDAQVIASSVTSVDVTNLTNVPIEVDLADQCPAGGLLAPRVSRVINTSATAHFVFSIDEHPLKIIEVDG